MIDEILETAITPSGSSKKHETLSTIAVIILGIFIAVLMAMFVFRSYVVDGPSMETTLQNGDRLIIWKLPHTLGRITGNDYVPNRGDIIVFSEPGLIANDGSTKQLIKRVIALPGERVNIGDGVVTVYNKEHPNGFVPDMALPYGAGQNLSVAANEREDITVGKNEVFAMGDNRDNSLDSRVFGPVPAEHIVGKLVLRIYPLGNTQVF
jgi:signal peptidase I